MLGRSDGGAGGGDEAAGRGGAAGGGEGGPGSSEIGGGGGVAVVAELQSKLQALDDRTDETGLRDANNRCTRLRRRRGCTPFTR